MVTRNAVRPAVPPYSARHDRAAEGPPPHSRVMDERAGGCENPHSQATSSPSGGLRLQGGSGHSMQVRAGGDKQQILRNH